LKGTAEKERVNEVGSLGLLNTSLERMRTSAPL